MHPSSALGRGEKNNSTIRSPITVRQPSFISLSDVQIVITLPNFKHEMLLDNTQLQHVYCLCENAKLSQPFEFDI